MDADSLHGRGVYDPAQKMRAEITTAMAKRFSLQIAEPQAIETKVARPKARSSSEDEAYSNAYILVDSIPELSDQNRNVDLVLDVRTTQWTLKRAEQNHYHVTYEGTLRLIDTRSRTLIAEGRCTSIPVATLDSPTYKQFLAGNAALLKASLSSVEDFCTGDYKQRILGLYGQ